MSKSIPTALTFKFKETGRRTTYTYGNMGVTTSSTIEGCIELSKKVIEEYKDGPYPVDPNSKIVSTEVIEREYGLLEEVESKVEENKAINNE